MSSIPQRIYKIRILLLFALILIISAFIINKTHRSLIDEKIHHLEAIKQYIQHFPLFDLKNYPSASGPIPYIIWSVWGSLFGISLSTLRMCTLLFGFGCIFILWRMLIEENHKFAFILLSLIVFTPYFLIYCFTIYTLIISLFFGLASVYFFRKYSLKKKQRFLIFYILMASAAVLSRQIYLSYTVGVILFVLLSKCNADSLRHSTPVVLLKRIFILSIPLFALGLLFLYWGGTTTPHFIERHSPRGLNYLQIDFIFIYLGFWFFPLFIDNLKNFPKWLYIISFFLSLHLVFYPLIMHKEEVEGFIAHSYLFLFNQDIPTFLLKIGQIIMWDIGFLLFFLLLQNYKNLFALICFSHFCILLFLPQVWERYYLPLIPILWFVFKDNMHKIRIYRFWVAVQIFFTIGYFLYKFGYIHI